MCVRDNDQAEKSGGGSGRAGEKKKKCRIEFFSSSVLRFFTSSPLSSSSTEQNTRHAWHILSDWMSFRGQITFSNAIKRDTVCQWAYACVCACVLACDVSVSLQISVRIESLDSFFLFFFSAWHFLWKSVASFLYCANFTYGRAGLCFRAWAPNEHVRYHSPFTIPIYLLIYHIIFLSFFAFFLCFTLWCMECCCDKISPPISYQLI